MDLSKSRRARYDITPKIGFLGIKEWNKEKMQTEEKEIASSSSSTMMMDPWSLFLYGMKAPMTREKYSGRLAKFFDFIGLTKDTTEERAKTFTQRGKKEPDWAFVTVLRFAQAERKSERKATWRHKPLYSIQCSN
jgi:hypothetical protein